MFSHTSSHSLLTRIRSKRLWTCSLPTLSFNHVKYPYVTSNWDGLALSINSLNWLDPHLCIILDPRVPLRRGLHYNPPELSIFVPPLKAPTVMVLFTFLLFLPIYFSHRWKISHWWNKYELIFLILVRLNYSIWSDSITPKCNLAPSVPMPHYLLYAPNYPQTFSSPSHLRL